MADLVGDIGGTNVRFAWKSPSETHYEQAKTYLVADFATIEDAIEAFRDGRQVRRACLALAGPVNADEVALTNGHWRFSQDAVRRHLGLSQFTVINDFTAQAWALPWLRPQDRFHLGGGEGVSRDTLAVLGPGTGLGVSGLIPCGEGWQALAGEGGHVSFAPIDDEEMDLLHGLSARFGRVSAERLLSGEGLENLYQGLAALCGDVSAPLKAPAITAAALADRQSLAGRTLDRFCAILGSLTGDVALTLGAWGGVYIAGGIAPRIAEFLASSQFYDRFIHKGRFETQLAQVPCYVVMAKHPALTGAAAFLDLAK